MEIVKRKDAQQRGLVRYFEGSTCPKGHTDERYTRNGGCIPCERLHRLKTLKEKRIKEQAEDITAYRAKRALQAKQWRERDPERAKEKDRKDRERDREKNKIKQRSWKERNKEHVAAYEAAYNAADPTRFRKKCQVIGGRRRARKRGAEGSFTKSDIARIYDSQRGLCNGCKNQLNEKYDIDHIMPISRGGSNWPSNLQLLCRNCNAQKSAMTMEEWLIRKNSNLETTS